MGGQGVDPKEVVGRGTENERLAVTIREVTGVTRDRR